MRKFVAFVGLLGVVYALALQHGAFERLSAPAESVAAERSDLRSACDDRALAAAYRDHQSRAEVCGHGVVSKVLKDDTQGSRHQRFIVRLAGDPGAGQTVLIAYNY